MAYTNQQIIDYLLANPKLTDSQIVDAMKQFSITPAQMASAVGLSEGAILSRIAATIPYGSSLTLGNINIVPNYRVIGSGEDQQIGPIESFYVSSTTGDPNYKAPVGSEYKEYGADGTFVRTGKTTSSGQTSFFGGLVDALKDPVVLAARGGAAYGGLLGGAGTAAAGTAGMSAAELAQLDLALGGAGGTTGATSLGSALTTGANVGTLTNLTGGSGLLTGEAAGITAQSVADKLAADAALQFELTNAGSGALTDLSASTSNLTNTANTANTANAVNTANTANTATNVANTANTANAVSNVANTASTALTTTELANAAKLGLTAAQYAQLFSTGATTAAGLLQQQTSREAAQKAQQMIEAETAAAKTAAQFRPVGMTTRFGTSKFGFDPNTGQLTSAGYALSDEAKAQQDRLQKLVTAGLTQAEGAQKAFEPLQTGAQSLFKLGAGYLAQSPEDVAKNYMAQQLALLKPGRELELANLQNKLQQQGRAGLSVAQGGSYGATTPELQALYNARAMQEAQLAAQAQQAGQQQVQFGAGLLGTGAGTLGQYYAGQQAAYAPYTTALGQVQALETAAQQPFTMGAQLGQTASTAGARVGTLGLEGANASTRLATGAAATTNPYATTLSGLAANPAFSQLVGSLFNTTPASTAMSALPTSFGTGSYYGNQDLGLFL